MPEPPGSRLSGQESSPGSHRATDKMIFHLLPSTAKTGRSPLSTVMGSSRSEKHWFWEKWGHVTCSRPPNATVPHASGTQIGEGRGEDEDRFAASLSEVSCSVEDGAVGPRGRGKPHSTFLELSGRREKVKKKKKEITTTPDWK